MMICESYKEKNLLEGKLLEDKEYSCVFRDGRIVSEKRRMLTEHSLDIYIDRKMAGKLVCSPQYLTELVLGYLYTEGIVAAVDEIESLSICEDGKTAEAVMKKPEGLPEHARREKRKMTPLTPAFWKKEWIFQLADRFAEGMPLHQETWATHSCFLAEGGKILFCCEDIGRHNAFDKAVGYALKRRIDLTQCIVYSSGRVPVDMIEKAVLARIPVFAAKAAPTAEAVDLAQKYGLTLIGAARQDSMRVYTEFRAASPGQLHTQSE